MQYRKEYTYCHCLEFLQFPLSKLHSTREYFQKNETFAQNVAHHVFPIPASPRAGFYDVVSSFLQNMTPPKKRSHRPHQIKKSSSTRFTVRLLLMVSATMKFGKVWSGRRLIRSGLVRRHTPADFTGRYKLAWDENNLYILAEITDDTLVDTHPDGLVKYWDDDCLEIFVDEDASGGEHQYSYNAFAYHIALDGKVVDIAPDKSFQYYNDHCTTRRTTEGKVSTWEVAMKIFDGNKYTDGGENIPKLLQSGKKMGFMLAYCDNDKSVERENFVGNMAIAGEDKNQGYKNASVFGILELK